MKIDDLPLHYNTVDTLEHNLVKRANKVAIYSLEREMTYRQVSMEVNQVGHALKKLGIRMGDFVGILSLDLPEWVTSFFGVVKIGGVAVGMSTTQTPKDYAYMLDDCRARAVIVHESLLPKIEEIRAERQFLEHVIVLGLSGKPARGGAIAFEDWIKGQPTDLHAAPTHRDDFCTLNYTSGTTGPPKGIQHAHKDFPISSQLYDVNVLGMNENDRTFSIARLFFTYGLGVNLFAPFARRREHGALLAAAARAANVLEAIARFKPTFLFNVPTGYASMMAVEEFKEKYDLSSLRRVRGRGRGAAGRALECVEGTDGPRDHRGDGDDGGLRALPVEPSRQRQARVRLGKCVEGFEPKLVDEERASR